MVEGIEQNQSGAAQRGIISPDQMWAIMQEKDVEFYAIWDRFSDEEKAAKVKKWKKTCSNSKDFVEKWFGVDGSERDLLESQTEWITLERWEAQ